MAGFLDGLLGGIGGAADAYGSHAKEERLYKRDRADKLADAKLGHEYKLAELGASGQNNIFKTVLSKILGGRNKSAVPFNIDQDFDLSQLDFGEESALPPEFLLSLTNLLKNTNKAPARQAGPSIQRPRRIGPSPTLIGGGAGGIGAGLEDADII